MLLRLHNKTWKGISQAQTTSKDNRWLTNLQPQSLYRSGYIFMKAAYSYIGYVLYLSFTEIYWILRYLALKHSPNTEGLLLCSKIK